MFTKTGAVEFSPLVAAHVFGGIAILLLVLWRLVVRFKRGAPLPPESEHPLLKMAAHLSHWLLYALMILMPVSGVLAWFGGIEQAATNHFYMKFAMLGLVALHVVAALFHQFVLKTNLIQRMKTPEA
jgi:cytochrome b561